jgi:hypothetical protein
MISETTLRKADPSAVLRLALFLGLKPAKYDDVCLWASLAICQRGPDAPQR